jgi:hypothetical protein
MISNKQTFDKCGWCRFRKGVGLACPVCEKHVHLILNGKCLLCLLKRKRNTMISKEEAIANISDTGYILTLQSSKNLCKCCCKPYAGNGTEEDGPHYVCHLLKDAWNNINTFCVNEKTAGLLEEAARVLRDKSGH